MCYNSPMLEKNIVLIGFMGSGKSIISKRLANMLNRQLLSTDDLIVQQEGRSVNRIFEESGEGYFRQMERKVVEGVAEKQSVVIDCGGGVVLNPENITDLKRRGILIYLSASPECIYENIKDKDDRPLLNVQDPLARIRKLLKERRALYEQADYIIMTDNKTADEVCEEVIRILSHD